MSLKGAPFLRQTTNAVIGSLLAMIDRDFAGRALSPDDVRRAAEIVKASPELDPFYESAYAQLMGTVGHEVVAKQRHDSFSRLIVHPLSEALDAGVLDRRLLHNFFFFLRSLFGEDVDAMTDEANVIADQLKEKHGDEHWDIFYADPRARRILFKVLRRIAEAFRNYESRKTWFLNVMQHNPTAIGVSSTVFIDRQKGDGEPVQFGENEFTLMFNRLMDPVRQMSAHDKSSFTLEHGSPPEIIFGDFLNALERDSR